MKTIRIALVQTNPLVGDLSGNTDKIIQNIQKLKSYGVDIGAFPELAICGYPPEDLLLKPYFVKQNNLYVNKIKQHCENMTVIVGYPDTKEGKIYNSAAIIRNKQLIYKYNKMCLPNYGVFDEKRYFTPGAEYAVIKEDSIRWSVNICEDIWVEPGPVLFQSEFGGAQLILNISASPYYRGKLEARENILRAQAKRHKAIIAYCNLVGGQDELVFDGGSLIVSETGQIMARARQFEEDILIFDIDIKTNKARSKRSSCIKYINVKPNPDIKKPNIKASNVSPMPRLEEIYNALVLGTRDYVIKNRFKKVLFGLSGGIDSALTALIAVDALGGKNAISLSMPSEFTSKETMQDAKTIAENLAINIITIPITDIFQKYLQDLTPYFEGKKWDVTEENMQARIRGNILMSFSNKFGYLVLTTGNKSETSVGYCTLYGDMAGGFAVLKDVPKNLVYELARYRNKKANNTLIPESVFNRPPTAELRNNQKDEDSIPPYSVLDPIIEAYVEKDMSFEQIVHKGFEKDIVKKVIFLIDNNEYKRRQAPPGIKITPKAFGKDRRMPITCRIPNGMN